ncbi:MAG TPA: cell division protein FtsL [Rhodoferax sp.]|jgi:cell division protein FtsL|nr:cell division protein FtsL [Rhodoferax sp.]
MMRLNLVLLLAVLATALYLVNTQYQSRLLFTALDRANAEAQKLAQDTETLQVEKRTQAAPGRVDQLARAKLQMRPASLAITQYVTYDAGENGHPPAQESAVPQGNGAGPASLANGVAAAAKGGAASKPFPGAPR